VRRRRHTAVAGFCPGTTKAVHPAGWFTDAFSADRAACTCVMARVVSGDRCRGRPCRTHPRAARGHRKHRSPPYRADTAGLRTRGGCSCGLAHECRHRRDCRDPGIRSLHPRSRRLLTASS
jgi:hypothetical protein